MSSSAISKAIKGAGGMTGQSWNALCNGIGSGVYKWAKNGANVVVLGSVNGTLGGGQVLGKFILPPIPAPVVGSVAAQMTGPTATQIATAVGIGIGTAYSAAGQYKGTSTGAVGADISKVVFANPAALTPLLIAGMASNGVNGIAAKQLAAALSPGIATMFMTGFGTGVAAGPTGPSPGTGVSKSKII